MSIKQNIYVLISYIFFGVCLGYGILSLLQVKKDTIELEENIKSISVSKTKQNLHSVQENLKNYRETDLSLKEIEEKSYKQEQKINTLFEREKCQKQCF